MPSLPSDTRVRRAADVVWRVGDGCVLVQRIAPATDDGSRLDAAAATLAGPAALVWVGADDPTTSHDLAAEIDLDLADVAAAIDVLIASDWLTVVG